MTPTRQGSIRLFRVAGIDLFLHWSWFIVALIEIRSRSSEYSSVVWNALEYLALFAIVLMHELGHALACRQVGGKADQIVLWPLGGVAYVSPPPRPGAMLWSIAAGPLVNVVLAPILVGLLFLAASLGWQQQLPSTYAFVRAICFINIVLLIFNLLPIYPLDGGQILRSLLWFAFGRARSLLIASMVGLGGVALLVLLAVALGSIWMGIIAVFILLNCWGGLNQARLLAKAAKLPRHEGFACPTCKEAPFRDLFLKCSNCQTPFDIFAARGVCPHCSTGFLVIRCPQCGNAHPLSDWTVSGGPPVIRR